MRNIKVWKEKFAIVKAKKALTGAFANIDDGKEITVIADERKINKKDVIKIQEGYKLITFKMVLPFSLVGFMAKVSKALAEEKIPIFVISAYSTDHILIKEEYLEKTLTKLRKLKI